MRIYHRDGEVILALTPEEAEEWAPDFEGGIYVEMDTAARLKFAAKAARGQFDGCAARKEVE